jgi:type II secretory pathway pseudopilin PulG
MRVPRKAQQDCGEDGFLLVAMIVATFLVLLALSIAAPRIATQLKRDRELETQHRAKQYVRAIRMYYKKFNSYPASMDALKKSNNQRFLRQEYVDPMTGEKDWKLIRVGQNKTKVKGFFGEDLPGLPGGLGAAAGMSSGSSGISSGSGPAFGSSPNSGMTGGSALGGGSSPNSGASASSNGSASGPGSPFGTGSGSSSGSSSGTSFGTGSGSGFGSSTDSLNGGVGPFMGVGVPKSGEAILTVNEQVNYQDWEFLYDPRIEQMYAKANLLGGGISSGSATGLGSAGNLGSGFGATTGPGNTGTGFGGSGTTASPAPASPTSPNTPPQ